MRVYNLARYAEFQGAMGVVLNAPTSNDTIRTIADQIDIPVLITVVSEKDDIQARLDAGANILNVSGGADTIEIVHKIHKSFPDIAIIATGGPNGETIKQTIEADANAITWTPPTNGEIFRNIMEAYRKGEPHP